VCFQLNRHSRFFYKLWLSQTLKWALESQKYLLSTGLSLCSMYESSSLLSFCGTEGQYFRNEIAVFCDSLGRPLNLRRKGKMLSRINRTGLCLCLRLQKFWCLILSKTPSWKVTIMDSLTWISLTVIELWEIYLNVILYLAVAKTCWCGILLESWRSRLLCIDKSVCFQTKAFSWHVAEQLDASLNILCPKLMQGHECSQIRMGVSSGYICRLSESSENNICPLAKFRFARRQIRHLL
jgi:hypothetical protein